jgi:hypothetical protein
MSLHDINVVDKEFGYTSPIFFPIKITADNKGQYNHLKNDFNFRYDSDVILGEDEVVKGLKDLKGDDLKKFLHDLSNNRFVDPNGDMPPKNSAIPKGLYTMEKFYLNGTTHLDTNAEDYYISRSGADISMVYFGECPKDNYSTKATENPGRPGANIKPVTFQPMILETNGYKYDIKFNSKTLTYEDRDWGDKYFVKVFTDLYIEKEEIKDKPSQYSMFFIAVSENCKDGAYYKLRYVGEWDDYLSDKTNPEDGRKKLENKGFHFQSGMPHFKIINSKEAIQKSIDEKLDALIQSTTELIKIVTKIKQGDK